MKSLQEMKEPLKPNGFGTTWLGNLVEDLGVDFNKVQCRGSWDCLELDDDILSFTTETACYRCTEVEDLIKEKYPSIDIAFRCEAPGMAIYEKNNNTQVSQVITYYDPEGCAACETSSHRTFPFLRGPIPKSLPPGKGLTHDLKVSKYGSFAKCET